MSTFKVDIYSQNGLLGKNISALIATQIILLLTSHLAKVLRFEFSPWDGGQNFDRQTDMQTELGI